LNFTKHQILRDIIVKKQLLGGIHFYLLLLSLFINQSFQGLSEIGEHFGDLRLQNQKDKNVSDYGIENCNGRNKKVKS
jgi:hypothetical protein